MDDPDREPAAHAAATRIDPGEPETPTRAVPQSGGDDGDALAGTELAGQYRIVRRLASGGMGVLYLAEQHGTRRLCAIKVLRAEALAEDVRRRFLREGEILARLQHPNVVTVFSVGEMPGGNCFIAMEYLDGETLESALRDAPFPLQRVLRIGEQLSRALVAAHHQGIVHRDLKPSNIMLLQKDGEEPDLLKVLDFGIARSLWDADASLTTAGVVIGTPEFLSPEQARGLPVDTRSDQYSLGLILYQVTTGVRAITGATPIDYLRAHAMDTPAPLESHRAGALLPAPLRQAIGRLLSKDPAERPSAEEMVAVLRATRTGAVEAPHGAVARAPSRRIVLGIVAGALALAVGVSAALIVRGAGWWGTAPADPSITAPAPSVVAPAPSPEPAPSVVTPAQAPAQPPAKPPGPAPGPQPAPSTEPRPAPATPTVATPARVPVAPAAPAAGPALRSRPAAPAPPARAERSALQAATPGTPPSPSPRASAAPAAEAPCPDLLLRLRALVAGGVAPEACRPVREAVRRAEASSCMIPPDLGTQVVECL